MRNSQHFSSSNLKAFYTLLYLLAIVGIAAFVCIYKGWIIFRCPIHSLLHIPCPGCGMGRAISSLLHANLAEALHYNALSFILLPTILIFYTLLFIDLFLPKPHLTYAFYNRINQYLHKWYILTLTIISIIAVWIHHFIIGL